LISLKITFNEGNKQLKNDVFNIKFEIKQSKLIQKVEKCLEIDLNNKTTIINNF
jgi:hypothetical protein